MFKNLVTGWKWNEEFLPKNGGAMYGWFFWLWIIIMMVELFLLIKKVGKKHDEKLLEKVVGIYGLSLLLLEVYKISFFTIIDGQFPFNLTSWQFCSVPMYVMVLVPIVKNKKIKDALLKFLATYALIAGLSAIVIPEGLYWDYITISCHSYYWHTTMVVVGVLVSYTKRLFRNKKDYLSDIIPPTLVLMICIAIAIIANEVGWNLYFYQFPTEGENLINYFNLFYISSHYNTTLSVLRDIYPLVPYIVFVLIYIILFLLGGNIVWFITNKLNKVLKNS